MATVNFTLTIVQNEVNFTLAPGGNSVAFVVNSGAGGGEINTINSILLGEPAGSGVIENTVEITKANYDAAVIATTTRPTTLYVIKN